jgi:hypothetical protein
MMKTNHNFTFAARVLVLALTWFLTPAFAQSEMKNGNQYAAGSSIKSSYFGVQVKVPAGFTAVFQEANGSQLLTFAKPGVAVVVVLQYGVTMLEYQRLLTQPFVISAQLTLSPVQEAVQRGSVVSAVFGSADGLAAARLQGMANPNGFSPVLIALANAPDAALLEPSMTAVLGALKTIKAQASTGDSNTRAQWKNLLAGRLLSRSGGSSNNSVNGAGSTSSSTQLQLCGNGAFQFSTSSSLSVSIPDGAGLSSIDKNQSVGRWNLELVTANQAVLVLTDETGLQRRLVLQVNQNALLIDGAAFNVGNSSDC